MSKTRRVWISKPGDGDIFIRHPIQPQKTSLSFFFFGKGGVAYLRTPVYSFSIFIHWFWEPKYKVQTKKCKNAVPGLAEFFFASVWLDFVQIPRGKLSAQGGGRSSSILLGEVAGATVSAKFFGQAVQTD